MEVNSLATGYDGSIRINTKIDSKGFNQGLNAITGSLKKTGRGSRRRFRRRIARCVWQAGGADCQRFN